MHLINQFIAVSQGSLAQGNERHRFLQMFNERRKKMSPEWNLCGMMVFKPGVETVSNVDIIGNSFMVALKIHPWYLGVKMRSILGRISGSSSYHCTDLRHGCGMTTMAETRLGLIG